MKIIDFRVRAPFIGYRGSNLYQEAHLALPLEARRLEAPAPPSAAAFSMTLLLKEAEEMHVEKMIVPLRRNLGSKNSDLAALVRQYPDQIAGLAGIDIANVQAAMAEVEQYVVKGSCAGIVLEPGQDKMPWMVNSSRVMPLYEYCAEKQVPVCITYGGIMTPSLRYYSPEAIDDVAAAFPDLKIALFHGGWPYVTQMSQLLLNRDNVYLVPDFYLINSPGSSEYLSLINYHRPDRVIYASAYPLYSIKATADYYCQCGIHEKYLPLVMYHNAKEFLGI